MSDVNTTTITTTTATAITITTTTTTTITTISNKLELAKTCGESDVVVPKNYGVEKSVTGEFDPNCDCMGSTISKDEPHNDHDDKGNKLDEESKRKIFELIEAVDLRDENMDIIVNLNYHEIISDKIAIDNVRHSIY